MFLIRSKTHLANNPIRVPAEVVKITGRDIPTGLTSRGKLAEIPCFGVTMLGTSHGFDPKGQTTGLIIWANGIGTMVDPPSNAMSCLAELGISPRMIDSIILTHCHSDHDAGTFRKLLFDRGTKVLTTQTIMSSFLRKYAAITGMSSEFLKTLFEVEPVVIGKPTFLHGAQWHFKYSLHTIPCIGFTVKFGDKSISYSADTHYSVNLADIMLRKGVIGNERRNSLVEFPSTSDLILHEAGVPPIHTPISELLSLPEGIKKRLRVVHIAQKDIPRNKGLMGLETGDTVVVEDKANPFQRSILLLDLFGRIQIFRDCLKNFNDARLLIENIEQKVFRNGDLICSKGSKGDSFYILLQGTAQVVVGSLKKSFNVGDFFGETSLVTGEKRNADVFARSNVVKGKIVVAVIKANEFNELTAGTTVKKRLVRLGNIRKMNSWQLLSKNSVLNQFSTASKTQLETIMHLRLFKKDQCVWKLRDCANYIILIRSGVFELLIKTTTLATRSVSLGIKNSANESMRSSSISTKNVRKERLSQGGLVGDFDAIMCGLLLGSELICASNLASAMIIKKQDWLKYIEEFPGTKLILHQKQYVV